MAGLDWQVAAASDGARDQEIAGFVREALAAQSMLGLVEDLMDALGKGFAAAEIIWDFSERQWMPARYEWRDPRWFRFDRESGRELRLRDRDDPANGIPLQPFKWIVHVPKLKSGLPVRGGLAMLGVRSYLFKSYTLKDWLAFMEVFGMPLRVGKYGPGATKEDRRTLVNAVANLGTDAAAVIPDSMKIEFVSAFSGTGVEGFQRLAEFFDAQTSKAVLGQTMTADDGSSRAQAQVHDGVRVVLVRSDAKYLSAAINRDLVRPLVDLNFGPQASYPQALLLLPEAHDLTAEAQNLRTIADLGVHVAESVVRDRFGWPDPADGETVIGGRPEPSLPFGLNRQLAMNTGSPEETAPAADLRDALAAEESSDWEPQLSPVIDPLLKLAGEASSIEEFAARLAELYPEMKPDELVRRLAAAGFKARGTGDATDDLDV